MKKNLRKSLFILPSLFTLSSIFCGFYATLLCLREPDGEAFHRASLLIVFAMFFDLMDGRVARLTKTQSAFGVQIDSLADMVSFGVAPAVLVYQWSLHALGTLGLVAAFAFVACGAIRLARFNVLAMSASGAPKKPGKYIVGLPIPGAAGGLVSIVVANHAVAGALHRSAESVLTIVALLAFFMVSTIRFRSFKDLRPAPPAARADSGHGSPPTRSALRSIADALGALGWRTTLLVAFAICSSRTVAAVFHPSFALVWLLGSYLAIGVAETLFNLSRRGRRRPVREDDAADEPAAEIDA